MTTARRATAGRTSPPQAGSTPHAAISRLQESARIRPPLHPAPKSPEIPDSAQTSTACRRRCPGTECSSAAVGEAMMELDASLTTTQANRFLYLNRADRSEVPQPDSRLVPMRKRRSEERRVG